MAIAVTDAAAWAAKGSASAANSITSNTFNVASGDLVIIVASGDSTAGGVGQEQPFSDTLTDNQTPDLTWTVITSSGAADDGFMKAWFATIASAATGVTVTATRATTDEAARDLAVKPYIVTGHDPADPIGNVWNTSNTSTTNNWSPNTYTSSVNNSRGFAVAVEWNALGAPVSTDTESAGHNGSSMSWLSAYKAADTATSGTVVTFNFDASGAAAAQWRAIAFEIRPAEGGGGGRTTKNTRAWALGTQVGMGHRMAS
jgi:hypothetical protein